MASQRFHGEPTIDDILSDPIVQSLMRSDGLTYEDVHAAVALARLERQRRDQIR